MPKSRLRKHNKAEPALQAAPGSPSGHQVVVKVLPTSHDRRYLRLGLRFLIVLVLLGGVYLSRKAWLDRLDRQSWSVWMSENFESVDGVFSRWDEKWDQHFVPAGGGSLKLETAHMMYYHLPFKRAPFTVRIKLRSVLPSSDAWAQLAVATTLWPTPRSGPEHDQWSALKWEGLFARLRFTEQMADVDLGYGIKGVDNEVLDRAILDAPDPGKPHEWVLRLDEGLWSSKLDRDAAGITAPGTLPASPDEPIFIFGISGENMQLDSIVVETRPDSGRLADPGRGISEAKAEVLTLRRLDAEQQDAAGALALARQIIARRNSPYVDEALEVFQRRLNGVDAASLKSAQGFLVDQVARKRSRCGASYDAIVEALTRIQQRRSDVKGYFKALALVVLDQRFSRRIRGQIYRSLIDGVWDYDFRTEMEAFADSIEKDRAAASRFYRDVLRVEEADMLIPMQAFTAKSPLLARAMRFFAMNLSFNSMPEAKAAKVDALSYSPSLTRCLAYGGPEDVRPYRDEAGDLVYSFDSGIGDGCGLTLRLSDEPSRPADLSAFRGIELEIWVPNGLAWGLSLSENGEGPRGQRSFKGQRGADGEQYVLEPHRGTGTWEKAVCTFSEIRPQPYWGNQDGNNIFDTQAVDRMDLRVPAQQGKGTIKIRRITYMR